MHSIAKRNRPLSRRDVLRVGAIPFLGLSLPRLLQGAETKPEIGKGSGPAKSCIMIYQYGGLSHIDSWDPKPDGPGEYRGPYKPIATAVPGFHVGELMPRLAGLADKYAVIRSMTHSVPVHEIANSMLLAGQSQPRPDSPSFGSIVKKLRPSTTSVPSHVGLQKFGGGAMPPESAYLSGGFLGSSQAPLMMGRSFDDNPANPGFRIDAFDLSAGLNRDRVRDRIALLKAMESREAQTKAESSLDQFRGRSLELIDGAASRQAFDIDRESDRVRDHYGRNPLGQNLLLARRLVEAGVRLVNVVAWCGLAPNDKFVSVETWDMHGNAGIDIFGDGWNGLGWALPRCDQAVAALLEDLEQRGLLDSTLVVLVGEFGRTPRISKGAITMGRDHWSNCYSAMVAGAGIRGGQVYGASDRSGAYVKNHPVSPEDFAATLYQAMDIPPSTPIHPDGFSVRASTGRPIDALFS